MCVNIYISIYIYEYISCDFAFCRSPRQRRRRPRSPYPPRRSGARGASKRFPTTTSKEPPNAAGTTSKSILIWSIVYY